MTAIRGRHHRIIAWLALLAILLSLPGSGPSAASAPKPATTYAVYLPGLVNDTATWPRGTSVCCNGTQTLCTDLNQIHASWYYNWSLSEPRQCSAEFVPMQWGHTNVTPTVTGNSEWLLGPNEPNNCWDPSASECQSPEAVASQWHYLEGTGRKLVGPSVFAANDYSDTWLEQFMAECAAIGGCRIDAIGLHWYDWRGTCDVAELEAYLAMRREQFPGIPFWVTEWGCVNGELAYAEQAIPVIEQYLGADGRQAIWTLYTEGYYPRWEPLIRDGALTPLGRLYRGDVP